MTRIADHLEQEDVAVRRGQFVVGEHAGAGVLDEDRRALAIEHGCSLVEEDLSIAVTNFRHGLPI